MLLLFMSLLERGEEVILRTLITPATRILSGWWREPVFVTVFEEDGFQYRPEDIKPLIGPKTKPSSSTLRLTLRET